jgi:hypothetical protein
MSGLWQAILTFATVCYPPSATMHVAAHQTKHSQSNQGNTVILLF